MPLWGSWDRVTERKRAILSVLWAGILRRTWHVSLISRDFGVSIFEVKGGGLPVANKLEYTILHTVVSIIWA